MSSSHLRLTPDRGKRIRVFRNGDVHHKGINIVLNSRQIHDIPAFLDAVSEKIGLVLGAKRLFTLDGRAITTTELLEHNKEYVASSGGPFIPLPYGQQQSLHSTPSIGRRSGSSSAAGSRFRPKEESAFALSSASKKSAPAALAHPTIRQSRSIEPRRQAPRTAAEQSLSRQREKSTGAAGRRKEQLKGAKKGGEGKKKGKDKVKENPPEVSPPPAASPSPVRMPTMVATGAGGEEPEEEFADNSPREGTKTEVEIVEHNDEEEEVEEEGEEESEEVEEGRHEEEEAKEEDGEGEATSGADEGGDGGEEEEKHEKGDEAEEGKKGEGAEEKVD